MTFPAIAVRVMVASPGDAIEERAAIADVLDRWNGDRAMQSGVVLLAWMWERHAVPELGGSGQDVINAQGLDDADILVAVFRSRLGQPTREFASGTMEEIKRADAAGMPVHVYFSNMSHPQNVDEAQLASLRGARRLLCDDGLVGGYNSIEDLREKVRAAIEKDVDEIKATSFVPAGDLGPKADLTASDCPRLVDGQAELVVRNSGTGTARDVRVSLSSKQVADGYHLPSLDKHPGVNIAGGSGWSIPFVDLPPSIAKHSEVTFTWTERGQEFTESHSINLSHLSGFVL
ncbi:hypothetical protein QUV83_04620 [Cellulomonas cellasea]|uniref:hypothetical protein n=1 Tax=Cellulomonas cellasea TaxID=43670 RepID=UPI0025A43C24|nr:hypothetical protein [Cellulomonas cellasea]MDM8084046.1 hypothetical protein [Cellulomonas cellasea]